MKYENFKTDLQYFLPKHIITRLVGLIASARLGKFTTFLITKFVALYNINTDEMRGNITDYTSFNDFFSRPLKENARPIDENADNIVFPVDGTVSQFGKLNNDTLLQAKGHYYSADMLLGGQDGDIFQNGDFITIYLSPKDYHRVHIPFAGTLEKMTYIPGDLFSVSPFNAEHIPELFARNERVACIFNTEIGKMAVVFVGATIVRSIATSWAGTVAPNKSAKIQTSLYTDNAPSFTKGAEIGKFFMGSTVICLFAKDKVNFVSELSAGQPTRVGQKMAQKI